LRAPQTNWPPRDSNVAHGANGGPSPNGGRGYNGGPYPVPDSGTTAMLLEERCAGSKCSVAARRT